MNTVNNSYIPLTNNQLCYYSRCLEVDNDKTKEIEEDIGERVFVISKQIASFFNIREPDTIWFPGAPEGEIGNPNLNGDNIVYVFEYLPFIPPFISHYKKCTFFPKAYLLMTLGEIRENLYDCNYPEDLLLDIAELRGFLDGSLVKVTSSVALNSPVEYINISLNIPHIPGII